MVIAKIVVVTKDEYDLIGDFLAYHTALFGPENVIVVDNNSTDARLSNVYHVYSKQGVKVIHDTRPFAYGGQGRITTQYISENKDDCEWVIPLDTDEFLITQPIFEGNGVPSTTILSESIKNRLQSVDPLVTALRVVVTYESCETSDTPARTTTKFTKTYKPPGQYKTIFRSKAFVSVACGNHNGVVSYGRIENDPLLAHVHFHYTGERKMFERATKHVIGSQICNIHECVENQVAQLQFWIHNQLPAFHRAKQYLKVILKQICYDYYVQGKLHRPSTEELNLFVEANLYTPLSHVTNAFPARDTTIEIDTEHKDTVVFAEASGYKYSTATNTLIQLLKQIRDKHALHI